MNPFEWSWLSKSFLSLVFVIPAWISISFFERNFGIKGEVTMIWSFLGTALGTALLLTGSGTIAYKELFPAMAAVIFFVGVVLGSGANAFMFGAIPQAPNPALPPAIQGSSIAFVFILAFLLGVYAPRYFSPVTVDPFKFLGILLVLLGIVFITFGRTIFIVLSLR